jgi:hypothetical protein
MVMELLNWESSADDFRKSQNNMKYSEGTSVTGVHIFPISPVSSFLLLLHPATKSN